MGRDTARTLNRIMQTVITRGGTGVNAALEGYAVCGKTGTAQKTDGSGTYAKGKYIASFVGFAPAEDPAVTGPAFRKIAQETLSYLNISPKRVSDSLTVSREDAAQG